MELRSRDAFIGILFLICLSSLPLPLPAQIAYSGWLKNGLATFYGGPKANGTWKGACGYGDLRKAPRLGINIAAASNTFWANGTVCGACFQVECIDSKLCLSNSSLTVTVTDQCPTCRPGRVHFDLSQPAFTTRIAQKIAGIVPVRYRRVSCTYVSPVAIVPHGNAYWLSLLIKNVAGSGDLSKVEVKRPTDTTWTAMTRDWGSNFIFDPKGKLDQLSLRLTARLTKKVLVLQDCLPPTFKEGVTYYCDTQFKP